MGYASRWITAGLVCLLASSTGCGPAGDTCAPSPAQEQEQAPFREKFKASILETRRTEKTLAWRFAGDDATLDMVIRFVRQESGCCDSAAFKILVMPHRESIWLEVAR